jgi:hypothetical protein
MRLALPDLRRVFPLLCAIGLCALPGLARGGNISFTQNFVADFEFSFPAGSPLNPGSTATPFIPFEAVGALTFTIDSSINDPSLPSSVAITGFNGSLTGVSPVAFLPYSIDPNVAFVGGTLTNIVRDGGGVVTSADITGLSAYWELFSPGIRLYSDTPLVFKGHIGGLPLLEGDVLAGPDQFKVFLDTGHGPTGDPLFAIGQNRTLTARAVPEPGGFALLGIGAAAVLMRVRRLRGASSRGNHQR